MENLVKITVVGSNRPGITTFNFNGNQVRSINDEYGEQ